MDDLQRGLYLDLKRRCTVLQQRLAKAQSDPDLKLHAQYATESLKAVKDDIDQIMKQANTPGLKQQDEERLAKLLALQFRQLSRRVSIVQNYLVPPIERFSVNDRRMTRYVGKLAKEINWPGQAPIVSTSSDAGYMTFIGFYLIEVPAGEDQSLLALPDLIHEMGHILLEENRSLFLNDFLKSLGKYVSEGKDASGKAIDQALYSQWEEYWVKEFVSDMIATYVTGAVFGYQHIRLCSGYPARAFRGAVTHPADDARARGAVAVLRKMGQNAAADDVEQRWQDYIKSTGEKKTAKYDTEVPDVLIDALASSVVDACSKLGIRPWTAPQMANDSVGMMQEAWKRFNADPAAFEKWETDRLNQLWTELGVRTPRSSPRTSLPTPKDTPPTMSRCGATASVIMSITSLLGKNGKTPPTAPKRGDHGLAA